jgi:hypothetical protein
VIDPDVGGKNMGIAGGEGADRPEKAFEAPPAFLRRDLFIIVGVQKPEQDHERAGNGPEKADQFCRHRRFQLKCRERSGDMCLPQERLCRQGERFRDARDGVAVKARRTVDDRQRLARGTAEQETPGVDAGMAVQEVQGGRALLQAFDGDCHAGRNVDRRFLIVIEGLVHRDKSADLVYDKFVILSSGKK